MMTSLENPEHNRSAPEIRMIHSMRSRKRWAFLVTIVLIIVVTLQAKQDLLRDRSRLTAVDDVPRPKILYIVTSLAEYNTGTRATVKGSDRLQKTLIPVVSESVQSMVNAGYDVDVYLVCHFILSNERKALIQSALPEGVGLEVWNDASPIGYDTGRQPFKKVENHVIHLSRQHRFVIKDKLMDYDVFVNFEDDMIVHGAQVEHFVAVTKELHRLRQEAPDELPPELDNNNIQNSFHGVLTKGMLKRMIPGFIRVEVLLDEANYGAQESTGPVPIDLDFDGQKHEVNPEHCCRVASKTVTEHIPESPRAGKLMLWETNILPLGIRKMPESSWLEWVVLQRGPNQNNLNATDVIGDYWSNRNKEYWPGTRRPTPMEFKYINNQGGWMATREQLIEWHTEICPGGFLPPYEAPHYRYDGLDMRNVEWYSGGMHLTTVRHACNLQRVIMLSPEGFSKSLIYHSANNKQRQLAAEGKRESFVKANTLLGQLNTLRKTAEKEMH